jgi:hypothetical protein
MKHFTNGVLAALVTSAAEGAVMDMDLKFEKSEIKIIETNRQHRSKIIILIFRELLQQLFPRRFFVPSNYSHL